MKTLMHKLLLLLFLLPCISIAGNGIKGGKYTKEKKIAKAYIVNPDCALQVDNQFGSIYVTTWDENKTQIEVVIKVSGNNEDKVNKRLAGIDVYLNATIALVKAATNIDNMSGNNINMEINYTIKIPKKGSINLINQHGPIITTKIYGKAAIDCQYGTVNIEELNADNNSIQMQYCGSGKIDYMKSGEANIQYSNLTIQKATNLKLKIEYSPVTVNEVHNLNYRAEYGSLVVSTVDNATGSGDYTPLTFGYVSGNFNTTTNYGDMAIGSMSKNSKNIAINATYSNITVNYNENVPFDFEFYLEYGKLRGSSGLKFTEKSDRDFTARYKGYNKTQGVNRFYIRSEYGDINLGKN
ncbi:hypothetical protein ACX0HA_02950 [Flavobacterium hauense]